MKILLSLLIGPLLAISTAQAQCTTSCKPSVRYQTTTLMNVRYVPAVRFVPVFTTWTVAEPAAALADTPVVYAPALRVRPLMRLQMRPLLRFRLFGCFR